MALRGVRKQGINWKMAKGDIPTQRVIDFLSFCVFDPTVSLCVLFARLLAGKYCK